MNRTADHRSPIRTSIDQDRFHVGRTDFDIGEFWWDSDDWPTVDTYRISGVFRISAGRLIVTQVRLDGSDWIAEEDGRLRRRRDDEIPGIDVAEALDHMPLQTLFKKIRADFAQLRTWALENIEGADEASELIQTLTRLADAARATMKRPGPRGHGDSELAVQAEDCIVEAANNAPGAHERLAERWFCAPSTARDRIRRLRLEEWLQPGKAGPFTALPGPKLERWRASQSEEAS